MDVSRSGRVRKKSSKLADFESPDEIEMRQNDPPKNKKIKGDYLNSSSSSLLVDEMPPEQLLADDDTASDFDLEDILEIKEEDFDSLPFLKAYNVDEEVAEDLDIGVNQQSSQEQRTAAIHGQIADERTSMEEEDFDSDEGNLMIDDTRGRTLKKGKQSSRKRYTAVERIEGSKKFSREEVGKTAFMLWAKSVRSQLAKQNPEMDFVAIRKHLGEMWGNLPNSEKNEWKRRATGLTTKTRTEQCQIISPRSAGRPSSATLGSGTSLVGSSPILAAAITKPHQKQNDSGLFKVVGTEPIDVAAHLKLLGESLSTIGERLCEHEGQIAVSGSLSVLLDSLLCATAPLLCLTQQVPELDGIPQETLNKILDNIAYIMPGL